MTKIDTIIFDLDGTLLYTLDDLKASVNYALSKHNMPQRSLEEIRQFVGNGVERLMELAVPDGKSNPEFATAFEEFKSHYLIHCNDTTRPYDGIMELLKELKKRGYKMAIVSNKYMTATQELNAMYFDKYITAAIGQSDSVRKKPAPDTVIEALKRLGSTKESSIYVGDSDVDVATARNSELPCISCLWGFRTKEELIKVGADTFVNTPGEILDII
ncbi:MAG: HAD family hydrolase [Butyrivibrio sp.]|nr:HAD family hydrolase [Butyrivibrio sp.]